MDEENILGANDLAQIKEVLKYLVSQEKIRQEEIASLKDAITGVDSYAKDYVDGQNFNAFKDKFGEKLDPYNSTMRATEGDDFDMAKSTYDSYKELGDDSVSQEDFVNAVVEEADKYITNLKSALGLPEDAAVEVTDDGNGNVEVKADENGDGVTEPISEETATEETTEEAPTEETPAEETKEEEPKEKEEDPSIEEALKNYKPKNW